MCQPLSAGGRRCAIHTHTATARIRLAVKSSKLTRYQTERLFSELTREGRRFPTPTEEVQQQTWKAGEILSGILGGKEQHTKDQQNAEQHDREIDGPAWYAVQTIISRANKRAEALQTIFEKTADRTGLTWQEVQHKYETTLASTTRERGAEYPPEYTPNTRRLAVAANVPYDVASVVALETIKKLESNIKSRITGYVMAPVGSPIDKIGYDNGRLEIKYKNRAGAITETAYRDVPESVWNKIKTSQTPEIVIAENVSGKREYLYSSAEEADKDGQVSRCASCGQFEAQSHSCPNRKIREKLVEQVGVKNVVEVFMADPEVGNGYETENATPAPVEDNTDTEIVPPAPDNTPIPAAEFPTQELKQGIINPDKYPTNWKTSVPGFMFGSEQAKNDMIPTIPSNVSEQINMEWVSNVAHEEPYDTDKSYYTGYVPRNISELPEYEQVMKDKPEYIKPVFFVNRGTGEKGFVGAYDTRYYADQTGWGESLRLRRVFKTEGLYETSLVRSQELLAEAETHVQDLKEHADVVKIDSIASVTKRNIDKTAGNKQPATRVGDARQIKKALREGKAVIVPAYMEMNRSSMIPVDDQGFSVSSARSTVQGQMVFRRNTDGTIETLSKERTLKCSCYNYRSKYYCEHVSYAHRHFANVIAQIATPPVAATDTRTQLLGNTLTARENIEVTGEDTDNPTIVFTNRVASSQYGTHVTREDRNEFAWRIEAPAHLTNLPEQISFQQAKDIIEYDEVIKELHTIVTPNRMGEVRTALRRANVALPVAARFGRYGTGAKVTGTITYLKTSQAEKAEVKEHDLKCDCPEYQEKYYCEHVALLLGNSSLMLNVRSRNATAVNPWPVVTANNRDATVGYVQVVAEMRRTGGTREEAEQALADRQAAEQAEREAYRIRREQEHAIRQAEYAARNAREIAEREEANTETQKHTQQYVSDMVKKWENTSGSYAQNPDNFYEDVKAALKRKKEGDEVIAYKYENVTDGMATVDTPGGRAFGVELEFELSPPDGMSHSAARESIAEELYAAGLTSTSYQQHYHAGKSSEWAKWSYEDDSTVGGGEIVSPLLHDTPEDWKQLSDVIDIMKKYGAVTSTSTGSHVHVSTASYGSSTAKNAQLLRDTNADADTLFRLATDPKKGKHRGMHWCGPNVDDREGDISADRLEGHRVLNPIRSDNHNIAVNFGGATNDKYSKNHVEFRHWDATLDKSVIQQQIVVSLGVVDRAERTVEIEKGTSKTPKEKHNVGSHRAKERDLTGGTRKNLSKEDFFDLNSSAMNFIDSIVRRPEDKASVASLFAITKWQDLG